MQAKKEMEAIKALNEKIGCTHTHTGNLLKEQKKRGDTI